MKTAKEFKNVHAQALPGMKILNDEIKRLVGRGLPIATLRNASENIKVQASTPTFHNRVPNDAEMVEIEAAYAKLGEAIELSKAERALQAAERAEAQAKVKQESE